MSTSGGGFAASGLLQGFAQAYNSAYQRRTAQQLEERHNLAQFYLQAAPSMSDDAKRDAMERVIQIYGLPPGKKLPSQLSDPTTLGQKYAQARQLVGLPPPQPGAQGGQPTQPNQPSPQPGGSGATPIGGQATPSQGAPPLAALPPPNAGMAGASASGEMGMVQPPPQSQATAVPQGAPATQPGQSAPLAATPPPSSSTSPFLTFDEQSRRAANAAAVSKTAEVNAEIQAHMDAHKKWRAENPTAPEQEFLVASGRGLPVGTFVPHILSKNVSGADALQSNPEMTTMSGEKIDPKSYYDISSIAGQAYAVPAGIGAQVALSNINATPFKSYMNESLQQGVSRRDAINGWNDRQSTQHGFKMVQQPDGSIQMVPVTTTTENKRGQIGGGSSASASSSGRPVASTASSGRTVGGKLPPDVAKDQETYLSSIERYNVMSSALPKALAGDQQAMINLLYNHIGMTVGLQKGARITQDIINEAQHSAPWIASLLSNIGVGNGFTMTPQALRGVTIPPDTMHNMIGLAEDRVSEDYNKFLATKQAYAGGGVPTPDQVKSGGQDRQHGRTPKPLTTTPPPKAGAGATQDEAARIQALIAKHSQAAPAPPQ